MSRSHGTPSADETVDELTDELTEIGLDEAAARVYVHLSRLGPSKVRAVSEAAEIQRTKTYRVLGRLEKRGFVTATMESPTRYKAVPPEEVFDRLLSEEERRIERLDRSRERLVPQLDELRGTEATEPVKGPSFRTIEGRDAIYRTLNEMVEEASDRLRVVSTHPAALELGNVSGLRELVFDRLRNEELELDVVFGEQASVPEAFVHQLEKTPGARGRTWATDRTVRLVVKDQDELLLMAVSDPSDAFASGEDVAIWTDAPALVESQLALFETVWSTADALDA